MTESDYRASVEAYIYGLQQQLVAADRVIEAATGMSMRHRASRMAGMDTPALDAFDAAKRDYDALRTKEPKP